MTSTGASAPAADPVDGRDGGNGAADTADVVDWELAARTGIRLARPGPRSSADAAAAVVEQLRTFADDSEGHVADFTGLRATSASAPVLVVDRPGWITANTDAFRVMVEPLARRMAVRAASGRSSITGVGARMTGLEAGAVLAFLSGKVLGQFDPFWPPAPDNGNDEHGRQHGGDAATTLTGRLLLVAPNVVAVERELDLDARDFRFWVCLHEETHRVQFTAVPWLRDHLRGQLHRFLDQTELEPSAYVAKIRESIDALGRSLRGGGDFSLLSLMQTPEQRRIVESITATMSLLEGHADVVMDGVGPGVIPTVATIRKRFDQRRGGGNPFDQVLRRLLGLDAKMRQYRDGAVFVRGAVDRVGMDGFNAVWTSPETLPRLSELTDPGAWVRRVHG